MDGINTSLPSLSRNSPNAAAAAAASSSTIDGTQPRGASPQEGQEDPIKPATLALNKDLVDEPHQRPPELSNGKLAPGEGTTVDLYYADPDIVGSWGVRLVQGGLSEGIVSRYCSFYLRDITESGLLRRLIAGYPF